MTDANGEMPSLQDRIRQEKESIAAHDRAQQEDHERRCDLIEMISEKVGWGTRIRT